MKTKLLFFTTLLLLQIQSLFSQCVSIELSVTWEREPHIYRKNSMVCTPKLNITYRNNCDTNYYFLKVSDNKDNLSKLSCLNLVGTLSLEKPDYHEIMSYYAKKGANQNFNVKIDGSQHYNGIWYAYHDSIDLFKSHLFESINCILKVFEKYIRLDKDPDYYIKIVNKEQSIKLNFEPSDMLPENILSFVKDQFVFLKASEIYVDTYNLTPFQIVEGCYTFLIAQDKIENYVLNNQYDSKFQKFVDQKLELPTIAGEYQLYSGAFNTNKITVCFGEK